MDTAAPFIICHLKELQNLHDNDNLISILVRQKVKLELNLLRSKIKCGSNPLCLYLVFFNWPSLLLPSFRLRSQRPRCMFSPQGKEVVTLPFLLPPGPGVNREWKINLHCEHHHPFSPDLSLSSRISHLSSLILLA